MESITKVDLQLINDLYARNFIHNTILSNASDYERAQLLLVRRKLKSYANFFSHIYSHSYGPFETEMSTGNPVGQSTLLNNVWAGLFKGTSNKQYSAQISFVINRFEECLDVGFYFGRAAARSLANNEKKHLESQFLQLGKNLALSIDLNKNVEHRFNSLFDFGFKAYLNGTPVSAFEWRRGISQNPQASQIIAKIYPNDFGVIEMSTLDSFVAQVIFLMKFVTRTAEPTERISSISPEQYVKQAERFAEIGLKGELFVLAQEKVKLEKLGFLNADYPRHVALESNKFGYDILSKDNAGDEIFIEVKSTTRTMEDGYSREFFLSNYEYETYKKNKSNYKLARVYNVENVATVEYLDFKDLTKRPDGFIITY